MSHKPLITVIFLIQDGGALRAGHLISDSTVRIDTSQRAVWGDVPLRAALTVKGSIHVTSNGETRFVNTNPDPGSSGYVSNTLSLWNTGVGSSPATTILSIDTHVVAAFGYQNPIGNFYLNKHVFMAASALDSNGRTWTGNYPPGIGIGQEGYDGTIVDRQVMRLSFDSLWTGWVKDKAGLTQMKWPALGGAEFYFPSGKIASRWTTDGYIRDFRDDATVLREVNTLTGVTTFNGEWAGDYRRVKCVPAKGNQYGGIHYGYDYWGWRWA